MKTPILNPGISGFYFLHSRADLPVAWGIPPCLCLPGSEGQTRIWLPSSSPYELKSWQSTSQERNPLPRRERPKALQQLQTTTGKSPSLQNLHRVSSPPFKTVEVAAATTLTRHVFPNLLDLSWLQPPKYLQLLPPSCSSTASSRIWLPPTSGC